ncbi:MAG: amidohydrolase [Actinomycetia bacterium]|nr:amidohydrolase [Actinomycetes bacterium]
MDEEKKVIRNGSILIEEDTIRYIGKNENKPVVPVSQVIDGKNKVALPGLINGHTHAAMTLFRGYADDMGLKEWLETKIWPREAFLKPEDVYWGTMLAIIEMIKGGTTCFADMYWHSERVAEAVLKTGIRASLCGVLLGVLPTADRDLEEAIKFVENWHGKSGLITAMLGPHALYTCQTEHLREIYRQAKRLQVGVHIHFLETKTEKEEIKKLNNKEPIAILKESGLIEIPILAAHSVYVSREEMEVFKNYPITPVHCPGSNLKLASGIAPIPDYIQNNILVGLGTDGAASNNNLDMFEEMRLSALIHKVNKFDPTVISAYQALEMATLGGAKAVGLKKEIGQLKEGMKADIILVNLNQPHLTPVHNVEANLVYSASASDVTETIINGKILMKEGKLVALDEQEIMSEAARVAKDLMSRG